MAELKEYRRKRDPKKTPEPFGSKKRGKEPIFVVQRHDARRLHYDFRLERNAPGARDARTSAARGPHRARTSAG
jgi:hypothetical protein